jgi:exodeoxyribonuclease VII large subunit
VAQFGAQLRSPAEQIAGKQAQLTHSAQALDGVMRYGLREYASRLTALASRLRPDGVARDLVRYQDGVESLWGRLNAAASRSLPEAGQRLAAAAERLEANSYQGILDRGYVVVRSGSGQVVDRRAMVSGGDVVSLQFRDGTAEAVVGGGSGAGGGSAVRRTRKAPEDAPRQETLF